MPNPRLYVEAPPVTPRPFGLLSVATVLDDTGPHWQFGTEYQSPACSPARVTEGACLPGPDQGTVSVAVDDAGVATYTFAGQPDGTYTFDAGDGSDVESDDTPAGHTHTYAAPGSYVAVVRGPDGYTATVPVTVTADTASGPFDGSVRQVLVADDGIAYVEGFPFTTYHLFTCRMPAGGWDEGRTRAAQSLQLGESRAVESVMAAQLALAADAVDLTPAGGAIHPVDGVALLEAYAAAHYGGNPTLHVPVDVATVLTSLSTVDRYGTSLQTRQGALVAAGAGYDALPGPATTPGDDTTVQAAGDGEAWLYITGQVVARRGAVDTPDPSMSVPYDNEFSALAQRPWVLSHECITAAVLVRATYEVPDQGAS